LTYMLGIEALLLTLALFVTQNRLPTFGPFWLSFLLAFAFWAPILLLGVVALVIWNLLERFLFDPPDPYPFLILRLLDALALTRRARSDSDETAVPGIECRREIARSLETGARSIQSNPGPAAVIGGGIGSDVSASLAIRWRRVAAWLRELETRLMWPSADGLSDVEQKLSSALIAACSGDFAALGCEPPPRTARSWIQRNAVRVTLAALVLASAWLIPLALGHEIAGGAASTLRITLIITAVTALLAPEQALSDAATTVTSVTKGGGG
jgi:hypothetical protein